MANDTSLGGLFAGNKKPAQFGRIFKPDPAWLAKAAPEPILDPELEIVDTHHHLWDMPGYRYLLDDFLADANTGHKVVATVFEECRAMYRARGPVEMKPVGEVEFAAGVAAMILQNAAAVNATFIDGIAVVVRPITGAMAEATVGGQQVKYVPK